MNKTPEKYSSPLLKKLMSERDPAQTERVRVRMLLAARIDDALKAKGWKKKDLAEALGKEPSVITKWLSGTHNFTSDTLTDIGRVLNIKLLNTEEKPNVIVKKFQTVIVTPTIIEKTVENIYSGFSQIMYSSQAQLEGTLPN